MRKILLTELLETGAHFGHKASKWNPNCAKFIFEERDNIHIIDLVKTKEQLEKAARKVAEIAKKGEAILFVGTKRQASGPVREIAKKAGIPYMAHHWVGGLISNWGEVKKNVEKMNSMVSDKKNGKWKAYPKHEQVALKRELDKLTRVYEGVGDLDQLPQAIYIIDTKIEKTAIREAKKAGLFSIGVCDTNCDPRAVDIAIPSNDDATGAIEYITEYLALAYTEGIGKRPKKIPNPSDQNSNKNI